MNSSCKNCINQNSSYCEPDNKTKYGYCDNWDRIVTDNCMGCEWLYNGFCTIDKCPFEQDGGRE